MSKNEITLAKAIEEVKDLKKEMQDELNREIKKDSSLIEALEVVKLIERTLRDYDRQSKELKKLQETRKNLFKIIESKEAEIKKLQNAYKQCAYERDVFLRENPVEMALLIDEQAEKLKNAEVEIERMNDLLKRHKRHTDSIRMIHTETAKKIKAEASKGCLENLIEYMHNKFKNLDQYEFEYITERDINDFLKETGVEFK